MNGTMVHNRIENNLVANAAARILVTAPNDAKVVEATYLAVLSRRPSAEEAPAKTLGKSPLRLVKPLSMKFSRLTNLKLVRGGSGQSHVIEAAIPLIELGLKPAPGAKLKFDWGILTTGRNYWANRAAVGVTNEAIEARLNPSLWGTLQFGVPDKQPGDTRSKKPESLGELLDKAIKFK